TVVLSLFVGGAITLSRAVPGSGKAQPAGTASTPPAPSPSVSQSPAPSPSFGSWPVVVVGANPSPYRGPDERMRVVASGSVDGIPWSATAGHDCIGLFVRRGSGGTLCVSEGRQPLLGMVVDSEADGATGKIGYFGALAPRVERLEVRLEDGEVRSVDIVAG